MYGEPTDPYSTERNQTVSLYVFHLAFIRIVIFMYPVRAFTASPSCLSRSLLLSNTPQFQPARLICEGLSPLVNR